MTKAFLGVGTIPKAINYACSQWTLLHINPFDTYSKHTHTHTLRDARTWRACDDDDILNDTVIKCLLFFLLLLFYNFLLSCWHGQFKKSWVGNWINAIHCILVSSISFRTNHMPKQHRKQNKEWLCHMEQQLQYELKIVDPIILITFFIRGNNIKYNYGQDKNKFHLWVPKSKQWAW